MSQKLPRKLKEPYKLDRQLPMVNVQERKRMTALKCSCAGGLVIQLAAGVLRGNDYFEEFCPSQFLWMLCQTSLLCLKQLKIRNLKVS